MRFSLFRRLAKKGDGGSHSAKADWKPGDIFLSVTGKSVDDCRTVDEIDAAVSAALNLDVPLKFYGSDSGLVIRNGDVYPHLAFSRLDDWDRAIDEYLENDLT